MAFSPRDDERARDRRVRQGKSEKGCYVPCVVKAWEASTALYLVRLLPGAELSSSVDAPDYAALDGCQVCYAPCDGMRPSRRELVERLRAEVCAPPASMMCAHQWAQAVHALAAGRTMQTTWSCQSELRMSGLSRNSPRSFNREEWSRRESTSSRGRRPLGCYVTSGKVSAASSSKLRCATYSSATRIAPASFA
eukprot:7381596-Prymnesium_polylepis.1